MLSNRAVATPLPATLETATRDGERMLPSIKPDAGRHYEAAAARDYYADWQRRYRDAIDIPTRPQAGRWS